MYVVRTLYTMQYSQPHCSGFKVRSKPFIMPITTISHHKPKGAETHSSGSYFLERKLHDFKTYDRIEYYLVSLAQPGKLNDTSDTGPIKCNAYHQIKTMTYP